MRWNIGKTVESLSFKGKGMPENGLSVRYHPAKLLSWSNVFPRIGVEMKTRRDRDLLSGMPMQDVRLVVGSFQAETERLKYRSWNAIQGIMQGCLSQCLSVCLCAE